MSILKKIAKLCGIFLVSLAGLYAVLVLVSFVLARPVKQLPFYAQHEGEHSPLVLAHQGGEGEYPSNTRIAFDHAAEAGADVLDTDMHMTKDGVLVLAHDDVLDYRTNAKGAIGDRTYNELKLVDFAYNWSPDGGKTYPYRGTGIGVMTLDELFTNFPKKRFGVEIKPAAVGAPQKFCDTIQRYKYEDRVLVSSTNQKDMDAFRKICPRVATSATTSEARTFYIFQRIGLVGLYRFPFNSLQIPEKSGGITVMTKWFAGNAHRRGLKIYNWTIDTPDQAAHFVNLGADGVNTSYPARIIAAQK